MTWSLSRTLVAALGVGALACATPGPKPGLGLEGEPLSADDPRPAQWLAALHERAAQRHTMRGSARFSVQAPDLEFSRPQRFAAGRPGRIRVEILGLFDQIAAVLVTDAGSYQLFDVRDQRVEEGPVSRALLWQVARVDLTPEQVVDLLLGAPLPSAGFELARARLLSDGSIDVVLESGSAGAAVAAEQLRFDAEGRLRRFQKIAGPSREPALVWEARFDDYRENGGDPIAHELNLRFPGSGAQARLTFRSLELNPALPPGVFVLQLQRGESSSLRPALGTLRSAKRPHPPKPLTEFRPPG